MSELTSLILPIHNQTTLLEVCYDELRAVLGTRPYELIIVDDGSTDGSMRVLRALAARDPHVRVVRMGRRFGLSAALTAGFARARGATIVTIDLAGDADLRALPGLLEALDAHVDLVVGRRTQRTFASKVESWLIAQATGVAIDDYGSPIKVYRTDLARSLELYGNLYRLTPALASWQGANITAVELPTHADRTHRSRVWRAFPLLLDLVTVRFLHRYGSRPMQSLGRISGVLLAVAALLLSYLAVVKFGFGQDIGNRPLLLLGVLLAAVGVQFLVLGLLAEMLVRIYYEVQRKPTYSIREIVGGHMPTRAAPLEPDGDRRPTTDDRQNTEFRIQNSEFRIRNS